MTGGGRPPGGTGSTARRRCRRQRARATRSVQRIRRGPGSSPPLPAGHLAVSLRGIRAGAGIGFLVGRLARAHPATAAGSPHCPCLGIAGPRPMRGTCDYPPGRGRGSSAPGSHSSIRGLSDNALARAPRCSRLRDAAKQSPTAIVMPRNGSWAICGRGGDPHGSTRHRERFVNRRDYFWTLDDFGPVGRSAGEITRLSSGSSSARNSEAGSFPGSVAAPPVSRTT